MKTVILLLLIAISCSAIADTYVNGYTKRDGTYVEPYYRSSPDNTTSNNWSTRGNVNPYTGQEGTRTYNQPLYTPPAYTQPQPYQYNDPYKR